MSLTLLNSDICEEFGVGMRVVEGVNGCKRGELGRKVSRPPTTVAIHATGRLLQTEPLIYGR